MTYVAEVVVCGPSASVPLLVAVRVVSTRSCRPHLSSAGPPGVSSRSSRSHQEVITGSLGGPQQVLTESSAGPPGVLTRSSRSPRREARG